LCSGNDFEDLKSEKFLATLIAASHPKDAFDAKEVITSSSIRAANDLYQGVSE
jgi:hypothetical protein